MIASMYVSRFRDYLFKLLDTQHSYALDRVNDYVQPVIALPSDSPDHDLLRGEFRYGRGHNIPATVGNFGYSFLALPGISDTIAIVEEVAISTGVASEAHLSLIFGANYNVDVQPSLALDARNIGDDMRGKVPSKVEVGASTNVAAPVTTFMTHRFFIPANTPLIVHPSMVLAPAFGQTGEAGAPGNFALQVTIGTANQAFDVSYKWRERSATQREMNLRQV